MLTPTVFNVFSDEGPVTVTVTHFSAISRWLLKPMRVISAIPGPLFYLCLNNILANERRRYICNISLLWPRPCSEQSIENHRKKAGSGPLRAETVVWVITSLRMPLIQNPPILVIAPLNIPSSWQKINDRTACVIPACVIPSTSLNVMISIRTFEKSCTNIVSHNSQDYVI